MYPAALVGSVWGWSRLAVYWVCRRGGGLLTHRVPCDVAWAGARGVGEGCNFVFLLALKLPNCVGGPGYRAVPVGSVLGV